MKYDVMSEAGEVPSDGDERQRMSRHSCGGDEKTGHSCVLHCKMATGGRTRDRVSRNGHPGPAVTALA